MKDNFVHLHVHTDASDDGLGTVDRLVKAVADKGYSDSALAMTDHGTLANAVAFINACKRYSVKPIIGLEVYLEYNGDIGHLTLLSSGMTGFKNLVAINNHGHSSNHRQPATDLQTLLKHSDDIYLLTGCPSSPFHTLPEKDAIELGSRLKMAFGDRMFVELMFISESFDMLGRSVRLSEKLDLQPVITNDVHFPYKSDVVAHKAVTSIKSGYTYEDRHLWLKSTMHIGHAIKTQYPRLDTGDIAASGLTFKEYFRLGIDNTVRIANSIETVTLERDPLDVLPQISGSDTKLSKLAFDKLNSMAWGSKEEKESYFERAEKELAVINRMGYSSYFLILKDIVENSEKLGVRIGPGRGSGGGSLLLYLLDIIELDPMQFGLSFERFLNENRVGMPDVDIDFDSENREVGIKYAAEEWGAVPITTYSKWWHKSLVHDLARHLKIDKDIEDVVADKGKNCKEFEALMSSNEKFKICYEAMLGQIRHRSRHAGGVVITDTKEILPVERTGGDLAAAWAEGKSNDLSKAGFVKFDFLGLSALSVLRRLENDIGKVAPNPTENAPEFEIFRDGRVSGIFQFAGSQGIREMTMRMQPTKFEELVLLTSLYRPGALGAGTAERYFEWRETGARRIHPAIDDILAPTFGVIVYQEQVMKIFAAVTGGSLSDADTARRLFSKAKPDNPKWVAELESLKEHFFNGAKKIGMSKYQASKLWEELFSHSGYSFNKSHAAAYTHISWQMAWWKYHYPAQFFTQMLNIDPEEAQRYYVSLAKEGIGIKTPHVNISSGEYETDGEDIYMPLREIKFLGEAGVRAVESARQDGQFTSIKDFMERVPKKMVRARAREGLYHLGAFKGLSGDVSELEVKNDVLTLEELKSPYKLQQKYLGIIVPDKKLMRRIESHRKNGRIAGIVTDVKQKRSKYGPYITYKLTPNGFFWERGNTKRYESGDFVVAQTNSYKKAIRHKRMKI